MAPSPIKSKNHPLLIIKMVTNLGENQLKEVVGVQKLYVGTVTSYYEYIHVQPKVVYFPS